MRRRNDGGNAILIYLLANTAIYVDCCDVLRHDAAHSRNDNWIDPPMTAPAPETIEREQSKLYITDAERKELLP
jgi:hypothetical protein